MYCTYIYIYIYTAPYVFHVFILCACALINILLEEPYVPLLLLETFSSQGRLVYPLFQESFSMSGESCIAHLLHQSYVKACSRSWDANFCALSATCSTLEQIFSKRTNWLIKLAWVCFSSTLLGSTRKSRASLSYTLTWTMPPEMSTSMSRKWAPDPSSSALLVRCSGPLSLP